MAGRELAQEALVSAVEVLLGLGLGLGLGLVRRL